MPWAMESTRNKFLLYLQFVLFHLGVVAAITQTFTLPFAASIHQNPDSAIVFQFFTGSACVIGVMRIIRRLGVKYIRVISTPDDHFSLWLLTIWFFFAFQAANYPFGVKTVLGMDGILTMIIFFYMTAFFLIYVPFSKISHYLYYPFTRYYFGKSMGHRGVYPLVRKRA